MKENRYNVTEEGIITRGVGGTYKVRVKGEDRLCQIRGGIRHKKLTPAVGDRVRIAPSGDPDVPYVLEKIKTRKNSLVRPPLANVDNLVLVCAVKDPEPDLKLLDKMLIICAKLSIRPFVVFTKADLDPEKAEELCGIYKNAGIDCIISSPDNMVCKDQILDLTSDGLTGLAGPSGAGKSTICNHLLEDEAMAVGDISERLKRGKHTTRHVELFPFGEGYLTDTPGFTSLDLFELGVTYEEVAGGYPEIIRASEGCRFSDCRHIAERDCAVLSGIPDEIDPGRYDRYKEFYEFLYSQRNNYTGGVRK
ncbi:MAG: ribosome small subunit-dependent GTPase A [Clostridiales bacterium]|nr:ribosome small subunit-dependent GTPase A [Clostridiales bacterium]